MARTWKAAVVGIGVVGEWHVRLIPRISGCELVAVCDVEPQRAQAILDKYKLVGVSVYSNVKDMLLKEKQIDVVHVCTPSGDHMGPIVSAMESGKNVICEKPMEIELGRIDAMEACARAHNVRLAGIFQNRWNDANRAIKEAADQGRFGKFSWAGCFTPWYRPDKYYEEGGWRGTWRLDGGGAIMNQSIHAIDLLQWIVGPVKTVCAFSDSRIHPKIEVEDTLSATLLFQNGAMGTIMGTTAMYPGMPPRIEVGGENGTAVTERTLKMFKFREPRAADEELIQRLSLASPKDTGGGASNRDVSDDFHARNIKHILEAWESGQDAETNPAEARKAVAIVLAMYESARRNGSPVQVT